MIVCLYKGTKLYSINRYKEILHYDNRRVIIINHMNYFTEILHTKNNLKYISYEYNGDK